MNKATKFRNIFFPGRKGSGVCCETGRDCVKTQEERSCVVNFQALTKVRQRLTKDAKSFHTVWVVFATQTTTVSALANSVIDSVWYYNSSCGSLNYYAPNFRD